MEVKFDLFKKDDYLELKDMIFGLYREDPPSIPMTEEKIEKTVKELSNTPCRGQIIIFKVDNNIAGYGIIIFFWSNEYGGNILYIDELFVKKELRNKKIGTAFFDYLHKRYKDEVVALKLEVTPKNIRARTYYEKMGFKETRNTHLIKLL